MKQISTSAAKSRGKSGVLSVDRRVSFWIFIAAAVIAVVLRTYQLYADINHETGYYINGSIFLNYTTIFIAAAIIAIAVVIHLGSSKDKVIKSCILLNPMRLKYQKLTKKVSSKAALMALIMSALTMCEFGINAYSAVTYKDWSIVGICIMVFQFVAAITLISVAAGILNGGGITPPHCFFLASIPVWKTLEVCNMAMTDVTVSAFSIKIYDMFTDMASAVFFLLTIRFFLGLEKKRTRYDMCVWGYAVAIIAAASTIPRFAMYYLLPFDGRTFLITPSISDIGLILLPPALVHVFWSKYEYRVMPKLNAFGRRRWVSKNLTDSGSGMKSI